MIKTLALAIFAWSVGIVMAKGGIYFGIPISAQLMQSIALILGSACLAVAIVDFYRTHSTSRLNSQIEELKHELKESKKITKLPRKAVA